MGAAVGGGGSCGSDPSSPLNRTLNQVARRWAGLGWATSDHLEKTKSLFNNHDFRERSRRHAGKCVSCITEEICCYLQHGCLVSNSFKRRTTSWLYVGVLSRGPCSNHDMKSTSHCATLTAMSWKSCPVHPTTSPRRKIGQYRSLSLSKEHFLR